MLIMNAKTISGDRFPLAKMRRARDLLWAERRFDRAPAEGMKRADAARIDVNKNADCFCTK